jgi:hypothetical protein
MLDWKYNSPTTASLYIECPDRQQTKSGKKIQRPFDASLYLYVAFRYGDRHREGKELFPTGLGFRGRD